MTAPTVLILGANGRFGQAATLAFAAAGWRVLAQARRPLAGAMPASVVRVDAPLFATSTLADLARGASALVHAVNPDYTRWDTDLLPMARAGMDLAQQLDARFMLPGNVYNHGAGMPALISEDTPQRPTTRKGELRRQIERELAQRAADPIRPLRSTVLRAGDFFGAGTGTWVDQVVVKDLRRGKLTSPGPLDLPHAWAHLPDLAQAFVRLAQRPAAQRPDPALPTFECLHFAGHTLTNRQLLDATESAARDLGLVGDAPLRRGMLPWPVLRALGVVVPLWRELARMSYLWRVPHALDGRRLQQAIGPLPATPLDEAMRHTLQGLFDRPPERAAAVAT